MGDDLLNHLRELETELHRPEVRRDASRLEELLHESFVEIGRSGRLYDRAAIVELLLNETSAPKVDARDFALDEIADGVALLTYRSAHVDDSGKMTRHSLRASLWQRTERGWRVRFHQGTPTEACD